MNSTDDIFSNLLNIQKLSQSASEQVRLLRTKCTTLESEKETLKKHIDILRTENAVYLQRIQEKDDALENIANSVKKAVNEFMDLKARYDQLVTDNESKTSELSLLKNRLRLYEAILPAQLSLTSLCPPTFLSQEDLSKDQVKTSNESIQLEEPPASAPPRLSPPELGPIHSLMNSLPRSPGSNTESPKPMMPSSFSPTRRNTVPVTKMVVASPKDLNLLFHKLEADLASIHTRPTDKASFGP